jgi:hypothetical protein
MIIDNNCNRSLEECRNDGKSNRNNIVKNKIAVVTGGAQGFGAWYLLPILMLKGLTGWQRS